MLKAQLGQPIEGEYPPELVERYPEMRRCRRAALDGRRRVQTSFTVRLFLTTVA